MAKGFKTGGRTKGTPNRDKQVLRDRLSSSRNRGQMKVFTSKPGSDESFYIN